MIHKKTMPGIDRLKSTSGARIACMREVRGAGTGLFWLGGYASEMTGTKATRLSAWAAAQNRTCTRFDYAGCGLSSGDFADGTIGRWHANAAQVFHAMTAGAQILIGSSMGAWLALLLARQAPERVAGLVLIAPAPDFTEIKRPKPPSTPDDMDAPPPPTGAFLKEARRHLLLNAPIRVPAPVSILHGRRDDVVPLAHVLKLIERLDAPEIRLTLLAEGDHRLSDEVGLSALEALVADMLRRVSPGARARGVPRDRSGREGEAQTPL